MPSLYGVKVLLKQLYELLKTKEGRKFILLCTRLGDRRENSKIKITLQGKRFTLNDPMSFLWQYYNIYYKKYYDFLTSSKHPIILDCGANIGLASYYFHQYYPDSKIYAFEADPEIANLFSENVYFENVELINKAVWIDDKGIKLMKNSADGNFVSEDGDLEIESLSLKFFLQQFPVIDMLKMDIEGAEHFVVHDCKSELGRVKNIFIEYHEKFNENKLSRILKVLEDSGFQYYLINEDIYHQRPFKILGKSIPKNQFKQQLNIFASRP